MVQTRTRVRSLPGNIPYQQDFNNTRSKSLISLNCSSSPSSVDSACSFSLGDVPDASEFANGIGKIEDNRPRSPSLSTCSADNCSPAVDSSPDRPSDPVTVPDEDADGKVDKSDTAPKEESPEHGENCVAFNQLAYGIREEDDVFVENPSEQAASNSDSAQLSVIDEEKDDAENSLPLTSINESNDEASGNDVENDKEAEPHRGKSGGIAAYAVGRPRSLASTIALHSRGQSMSSLDIPLLYSQSDRLVASGEAGLENASTQMPKAPLRRGASSSFLTSRDLETGRRPLSHTFDLLDKGTVLTAISPTSCVSSRNLNRNMSASTPSIDSAVNELIKGKDGKSSSRKGSKHIRTPSMAVPAITPRIPLVGLLPPKISKPVEKTDGTKTRERSSGFFSSRSKRMKQSESRPHFWIKNSCSNSDCCHVCNKPLANTDAYQCNDCFSSVHASCKASLDKAACNKLKHPKTGKMQVTGPLRPPLPLPLQPGHKTREPDQISPFQEVLRSSSIKNQRHSVASIFPDASCLSSSSTAPAGLSSMQSMFLTYPNGFRSYIDMEDSWKPLGLWDALPDAWSAGPGKHEKKKLPTKEIKRQDNFHEMFVTEQHHCQTLTVLKCTYFAGLLKTGIVSAERLNQLLPCLDELIDIHYHIFRELKKKRDNALVVTSVHDVLVEQFSNEMGVKMKHAYTQFCFQKDATVREYNRLAGSSTDFANFIKTASAGSFYKSRSLSDCLLLVTQRLSKYHSFVENLRKNTADDTPEKEGMYSAERAVKALIAAVDSGIEMAQLQQARIEICNSMDPKATAELAVQDVSDGKTMEWKELFKVEDLRSPERTLLYYGDVFWQNARQKPAEITLLLFTDVIVFLQKNSSGCYNFFRQDQKNGVIKLHKLIVRDKAGRLGSQGIYLIAVSPKPDMYDISCKSKKELAVWMDRIQRAVQSFSSRNAYNRQLQPQLTGDEEAELQKYFDKLTETNVYMRCVWDARVKAYAEMFDYIGTLTLRSNEDKEKIASLINRYTSRHNGCGDNEDAATIWRAMQERFGPTSIEPTAAEEEQDEQIDTQLEERESGSAASAELGRSKTFHFVVESGRRPKLRKHPTVAGIPEIKERAGKRLALPQVMNELRQADVKTANDATLYLLNCWADFEMQIEELNQEKLRLTTELALAKEHRRQAAGALVCDSGLENLRRLSSELDARRKKFFQETSDKEIELNCREKALKEREDKLNKEDAEIRNRWACLSSAWENQRVHGLPLPPLVASPSNYAGDSASNPIPFHPNSPVTSIDSPPVSMQRTSSFRPVDAPVPPHLAGAMAHAGRTGEAGIRQQLPTSLSSRDALDMLSKKLRASSKDKGGKKYFISSKSPDRQMIPNKLAINKK